MKDSSDGAQHALIDNDKRTLVVRPDSKLDAACTCGVLPAKETIMTAFTGSTKMSCSTRENLSNTSPKTVKSGYNPLCDRTLTGTASTAQETLENNA